MNLCLPVPLIKFSMHIAKAFEVARHGSKFKGERETEGYIEREGDA